MKERLGISPGKPARYAKFKAAQDNQKTDDEARRLSIMSLSGKSPLFKPENNANDKSEYHRQDSTFSLMRKHENSFTRIANATR